MTQDIIEMARQHFCRVEYDNGNVHECYEFSLEELEAFVKLVATKERKEICGTIQQIVPITSWAHELLEAIRARGQA